MRMLVDKPLEAWLAEKTPEYFPWSEKANYPARYAQLSAKLLDIHNEVDRGALLADIENGNTDPHTLNLLTHHGPVHVKQVIERVSALLMKSRCNLTPYEAYMLLMAIHFHDVGNIYGREDHTKACRRVMGQLGDAMEGDNAEKKYILQIASAHGAARGMDKDTISALAPLDHVIGGKEIRPQLLAALLRFGDELADDKSRASCFLLANERIPPASEIHHSFSNALESVNVQEYQVSLAFLMTTEVATRKFPKDGGEIFLLDEIFARTSKMHLERTYCSRFLRPQGINIERISVRIEVVSDYPSNAFLEPIRTIGYRLEESGYPDQAENVIHRLNPELKGLCGQQLCDELSDGGSVA